MSDPWATADDVLDRWVGELAAPDPTVVERWIGDAETQVRNDVPDISDRLEDDDGDLADRVQLVIVRMVTRALKNPDRLLREQQAAGPFTTSRATGDARPGDLYLTSDDRRLIGAGGPSRPRAFSISTIAADE